MKPLLRCCLFVFFIITSTKTQAQCPPGDVTFTSQAQVDQFIIDYPSCTEIQGNLLIGDGYTYVDINDVSPLQNITTVLGDLYINGTDLTNIDELTTLTSINGDLWIYYNPLLTSIVGLINLTTIGSFEMVVSGNDVLTSLSGLDNINSTTVTYLTLETNESLSVCNVGSICSYLSNPSNLFDISDNVMNCNSDTEITAACIAQCPPGDIELTTQAEVDQFLIDYPNCTSIQGGLLIGDWAGQTDITDISALQNITSVDGEFSIIYTALTNVDSLNSLTSINGDVFIWVNSNLTSLEGLINLTTINNSELYIDDNPVLADISGIDNINPTSISYLELAFNQSLSVCNVASVCTYLSNPSNSFDISGNVTNCNSAAEVTAACDPCPPGDVELTTQAEIDQFLIDYPNCTSIQGGLLIGDWAGQTDITDISALQNITSVDGEFSIIYTALTNVDSLNSLTSINGDVFIWVNSNLTSLEGLINLTTINNSELYIDDNPVLADISGIDNINPTSISYLELAFNQSLSVCNVASVCTYLSNPSNSFDISGNVTNCNSAAEVTAACDPCPPGDVELTTQAEVDQFLIDYPNCTQIQGGLLIGDWSNTTDINDLSALQNITSIAGEFDIIYTALTNVNGLNALTSIDGDVFIFDNTNLTSLDGLINLTSINDSELYIENNAVLASLSGIDNIDPTSITFLDLAFNQNLSVCNVISVCNYLSSPGNSYSITNNVTNCNSNTEVIATCNPCPPGDVELNTQAQVDQFLIDYPNCAQIQGNLLIGDWAGPSDVNDISALQNVTLVSGEFTLVYTALTNVDGLNALTSITSDVFIFNNANLTSLDGLINLTTINGSELYIDENTALASLSGIDNIDPSSISYLELAFNQNLSVCNVASVCTYLSIPSSSFDITNNVTNCNSNVEVTTACQSLDVNDFSISDSILVYPNPFNDWLHIEIQNGIQIEKINLFDVTGKKIQTQTMEANLDRLDMSLSDLSKGMYFITIHTNKGKVTHKLIK